MNATDSYAESPITLDIGECLKPLLTRANKQIKLGKQ